MYDNLDMDALLKSVAEEDNAALPFAQWKEALLEKAAADTGESLSSEFELYQARRKEAKPDRKKLYRISGAIAGVAAAFVIMLSINANTAGGAAQPAPAATESGTVQQFAMDSMDITQENSFAAPLPPEEPMASASASQRSGEAGGGIAGYSGGGLDEAAPEAPMPEAAQMAPMMLDPNFDAAISAVNEALAGGAADRSQAKAAPAAVAEYEGTYSITPLGGGEAYTLQLPLAYVVLYTDGKHYIVQPLEPEGMEVLGTVDR